MKKLLIAAATCAMCALATSQPMPRDNDRVENHDVNRGDSMVRRDAYQQQAYRDDDRNVERHEEHHRQKVWVPSHHDDHDHHVVRGHYEWR